MSQKKILLVFSRVNPMVSWRPTTARPASRRRAARSPT